MHEMWSDKEQVGIMDDIKLIQSQIASLERNLLIICKEIDKKLKELEYKTTELERDLKCRQYSQKKA